MRTPTSLCRGQMTVGARLHIIPRRRIPIKSLHDTYTTRDIFLFQRTHAGLPVLCVRATSDATPAFAGRERKWGLRYCCRAYWQDPASHAGRGQLTNSSSTVRIKSLQMQSSARTAPASQRTLAEGIQTFKGPTRSGHIL